MIFDAPGALFDSGQVFDSYETTVNVAGSGGVSGFATRLKYTPLTLVGGLGTAVLAAGAAYGTSIALTGVGTVATARGFLQARPALPADAALTASLLADLVNKFKGTMVSAAFLDVLRVRYVAGSLTGTAAASGSPVLLAHPDISGVLGATETSFASVQTHTAAAAGTAEGHATRASADRLIGQRATATRVYERNALTLRQ